MVEPSVRQLLAIAPRFSVTDILLSAAYYRDVLGFTIDRFWGDPPSFCMPHRDGLTILLGGGFGARPHPNGADGESWDAYIWVADADALFEEFSGRGAEIVHPPEDRPYYGNREFAVRDPDGHIIAFAHTVEAKPRREAAS